MTILNNTVNYEYKLVDFCNSTDALSTATQPAAMISNKQQRYSPGN